MAEQQQPIVTGHTEFEGISYLTREVPDLDYKDQYIIVSEERLNNRLWNSDKSDYREPKAECQAKDEYIWGYLPTSDLLSMTDEQVFRALE